MEIKFIEKDEKLKEDFQKKKETVEPRSHSRIISNDWRLNEPNSRDDKFDPGSSLKAS